MTPPPGPVHPDPSAADPSAADPSTADPCAAARPADPSDTGPLAATVDRIWTSRCQPAVDREVLLPTGRAQIVFGLHPDHRLAVIQGPTTTPTVIPTGAQRHAVGLLLRPGGLHALVGERADDFVDRQVPLADAVHLDVETLIEDMRAAADRHHLLAVLDRLASGRLTATGIRPTAAVGRAVDMLRRGASCRHVYDQATMSRTRLVAAFRAEIGVTPKRFARLQRFEAAVARIRQAAAADLAVVAVECGYADQAHMTRDVVEFAGVTPGRLHRLAGPAPNHLPVGLVP